MHSISFKVLNGQGEVDGLDFCRVHLDYRQGAGNVLPPDTLEGTWQFIRRMLHWKEEKFERGRNPIRPLHLIMSFC
jgi:hypothetical protein